MSVHDESDIETLDELMVYSNTFETGEIQDTVINYSILVQLAAKKNKVLSIGQVEEEEGNTLTVKFMHIDMVKHGIVSVCLQKKIM
jgi:hypothetical protein